MTKTLFSSEGILHYYVVQTQIEEQTTYGVEIRTEEHSSCVADVFETSKECIAFISALIRNCAEPVHLYDIVCNILGRELDFSTY